MEKMNEKYDILFGTVSSLLSTYYSTKININFNLIT